MSQVESIYSFLPKAELKIAKPPLHQSSYKHKVREDWRKIKRQKATFGPIEEEKPHQSQYLKAGNGEVRFEKNRKKSIGKHDRNVLKAPTFCEVNVLPELQVINHIKLNITSADHLVPKKQDKESFYVNKDGYGKVPHYLVLAKADSQRKQKSLPIVEAKPQAPQGYSIMGDEERQETISLLTSKLKDLKNEYGKLSLIIDTVPKKNKKVSLENHIDEIESYLNELSSSKLVFIRE